MCRSSSTQVHNGPNSIHILRKLSSCFLSYIYHIPQKLTHADLKTQTQHEKESKNNNNTDKKTLDGCSEIKKAAKV